MRRFLVVGCGGSGAATLAYMRDHLVDTLARRGWPDRLPNGKVKLPRGWQFVVVDVPTGPLSDRRPKSRPPAIGGAEGAAGEGIYVSTGYPGGYAMLDDALSTHLAATDGLKQFGPWAPRDPWAVNISLLEGAGQHRAIGRTLLLQNVERVQTALGRASDALANAAPNMGRLTDFFPDDPYSPDAPLILVVSSMAGGAGASMALDLCRLLRSDPRNAGSQIALFMISADVFSDSDVYPTDVRFGAMPNALAMLGEIVAGQMGEAAAHDTGLLTAAGALGLAIPPAAAGFAGAGILLDVPFQRVFPVSNRIGGHVKLGDGSAEHIYRALGVGLASLLTSGQTALNDFISIDLTNPPVPPNTKYFGWGAADPTRLAWGSFGYASLSMGRDRYEHYAAQRLAHASVLKLLDGHLQAGLSSQESVRQLAGLRWPDFWSAIGLPTLQSGAAPKTEADHWFDSVLPPPVGHRQAKAVIDRLLTPNLPAPQGPGAQWLKAVDGQLTQGRGSVEAGLRQEAERTVYAWQTTLREATEAAVAQAIGDFGLEYARSLTAGLSDWLPGLADALRQVANQEADPLALDAELRQTISRLKNCGTTDLRPEILARITTESARRLRLEACAKTAELLGSYAAELLSPLVSALDDAQRGLRDLAEAEPAALGSADLRTADVKAWPSELTQLPERFFQAVNEIILTDAHEFPDQFKVDVRAAWIHNQSQDQRPDLPFAEALNLVSGQVVTGQWQAADGQEAPGGLLTGFDTWWAGSVFPNDPVTEATRPIGNANIEVHVLPQDLLDRTLAFVRRPNDRAFSTYTSVTLRQWLQANDKPSLRQDRETHLVRAFAETLEKARPLANASNRLTGPVNNVPNPPYRYRFSAIPFPTQVQQRIATAIGADPSIDPSANQNFTNAGATKSDPQAVAVFGSYQPLAPLVFESLLQPIADQRGRAILAEERNLFWRWRRARPLGCALPLSRAERRAMAAGWFIGQISGRLLLPDRDRLNDDPVRIWSEDQNGHSGWLNFPFPLLTPPGFHEGTYEFQLYDWLPAVLESILLAYAAVPATGLGSLAPYLALRGLCDSADAPSGGQDAPNLAGQVILKQWAESGTTPPGGRSRVPGLSGFVTMENRVDKAKSWLQSPKGPLGLIAADFEPRGRDSGRFASVKNRSVASALPLFADIAVDVEWAVNDVIRLLDGVAANDETDSW
ncbi:MAG: tubulin-like doman-containing protein [Propionibacteriaceae bacterium]|jgi:hypothetical protein|nr:tubulin-like doman-containing protein [Propionibacteriaceae bacterium]